MPRPAFGRLACLGSPGRFERAQGLVGVGCAGDRNEGSDAIGRLEGEVDANGGSERGPDHVHALETEVIEQGHHVPGVVTDSGVGRARGHQLAAEVAGDDLHALGDHLGAAAPRQAAHHHTVEQQQGFALSLHLVKERRLGRCLFHAFPPSE